jgi:Lon protease-like protein
MITRNVPLLSIPRVIPFPSNTIRFVAKGAESNRALGTAIAADRRVFIAPGVPAVSSCQIETDPLEYGCFAAVVAVTPLYVHIEPLARARVITRRLADGYQRVDVQLFDDWTDWRDANDALVEAVAWCCVYLRATRDTGGGYEFFLRNRPSDVVDTIAHVFPFDLEDKLRLLCTPTLFERLVLLTSLLQRDVKRLELATLPYLLEYWQDSACALLPLRPIDRLRAPLPGRAELDPRWYACMAMNFGSIAAWYVGGPGPALIAQLVGVIILWGGLPFGHWTILSIRCDEEPNNAHPGSHHQHH